MHAGYPWAPATPQDMPGAASTSNATSAAQPPSAKTDPAMSFESSAGESAETGVSHAESQRQVAASQFAKRTGRQGLVQAAVNTPNWGSARASPVSARQTATSRMATADSLEATQVQPPPLTPPSAGRGSEGGVSTSQPFSLAAKLDAAAKLDDAAAPQASERHVRGPSSLPGLSVRLSRLHFFHLFHPSCA